MCAANSRKRKEERFTAFVHHLKVGLLRESFYALKRQASPGVDGVTWQEYETGSEIGSSISTVGYTVERIGHNPHDDFILEG